MKKKYICHAQGCKAETSLPFCIAHLQMLPCEIMSEIIITKHTDDHARDMLALQQAINFIAESEGVLTPKLKRLEQIWAERVQKKTNNN